MNPPHGGLEGPIASFPSDAAGAIEHLYDDHHAWLRVWLSRRLGNAADAADLAHDVFLRLILRPAPRGFDSFGEARAYLRAMAQGMCINLWHRREIEQAWLDTLAARPEAFAPSAERQAMVLEALQEIGTLLLELPPKAARAFLMAAACQMTDREVAEELGVSSRMVRKYVAQAMLRCMQLQARQTVAGLLDPGQA
ncbi:MAG: sigma-70 family RNA polymerase sigma factor [Burkholderiales bacterium]|nr:sigma-70 family RNA polymerase sigma factor [Burkholderiales bacterium]